MNTAINLRQPSGAVFSDCGKYRWILWRRWGNGNEFAHICGLNPSTADHERNDPTVRREIDFCQRWVFDGLIKTNAFGLRATDPRVMLAHADPIGTENDAWITIAIGLATISIAAWGVHGAHLERAAALKKRCAWKCFGVTKAGQPRHPLYLPKTTTLIDLL